MTTNVRIKLDHKASDDVEVRIFSVYHDEERYSHQTLVGTLRTEEDEVMYHVYEGHAILVEEKTIEKAATDEEE